MDIMTPDQFRRLQHHAKGTKREHELQAACVQWFRLQHRHYAPLLIAVPNGAALLNGGKGWATLKAEGAVAGAADLLLLVPRGAFGYLAIEMKTPVGRQRARQREWGEAVRAAGGQYAVCRSTFGFEELVNAYLTGNK